MNSGNPETQVQAQVVYFGRGSRGRKEATQGGDPAELLGISGVGSPTDYVFNMSLQPSIEAR